ncbi:hypothetical protein CKO25_20165 [Thiocapsa imhoffii]|uniref:Uncharacterized protein n=2 Tax=Thiocapsa imhoffii TaxID=382777 RepID=A0A9X1BBR4_9GAMM|nr:hypothetical protein [Thiocapsa imhoffii]
MRRKKFDAPVPTFADAYDQMLQEKLRNKKIICIPKGGPSGVLDTHEKRLSFVLDYLKTYPTFDIVRFHFKLSAGHAHDFVVLYSEVLNRALESLNVAPKRMVRSRDEF